MQYTRLNLRTKEDRSNKRQSHDSKNDLAAMQAFLEHLAFLYQIDEILVDMQQSALHIQSLQQGAFVPIVAAYASTKAQEVLIPEL